MSHPNKDRKIRSSDGKEFPEAHIGDLVGTGDLVRLIAEAMHREFGGTHAAIKLVVGLTHANERAVKNWFQAKNGPNGLHLVTLMRHSDEVTETVLLLAGRNELVAAKKLLNAKRQLERMLKILNDLAS